MNNMPLQSGSLFLRMQILVIQTAFLGDVVLATPVIEKLHRCFPEAEIDFLLRKGNESLLKDHPFIRNLIIWDKKEGKWKNVFKVVKQLRKTKYDYVINLQRFATSGIITAFSGGKTTVGFDKNPLSFFFTKKIKHHIAEPGEPIIHEVERNLMCINWFTDDSSQLPKLYPSKEDYQKVNSQLSIVNRPIADRHLPSTVRHPFYITISPASVWFTKQYPIKKWVELIKALGDKYQIYLLGAPSDKAMCDEIITQSEVKNIANCSGQFSLLQSAALMQGAVMNYVNDSAPLHLASAMDAPVTVIFCSTVPRFGFGPSGTKGNVVETLLPLACKPCGLHGRKVCPEGHFKCALTVTEQQLLAVVK